MIAVIDSNVLVAGILSPRHDSPVTHIVDSMRSARFPFAISLELLSEYHRVLRYQKVARLHQLSDAEIDDLLTGLTLGAIVRDPPPINVDIPDTGDRFLFSLLHDLNQGVLVTGDRALIENAPDWASVLSPAAFIARV